MLACMDHFMFFEISALGELFWTQFALERFFIGVNNLMFHKICCLRKAFIANFARMWFLTRMNEHVPMQIGLLCKGLFTNVTFVGAFTGVAFFMFPPATVFAKCFHAYTTFVDFFCSRSRYHGCCIICLRMMYHSMSGQLFFIVEILEFMRGKIQNMK